MAQDHSVPSLEAQLESDITEEYRPGDAIPSERELVERYAVSRYLIRAALQRMAARGLIVTRPGARSTLNSPAQAAAVASDLLRRSRSTIDELYEARLVLEGGAVSVLAARIKSGELVQAKLEPLGGVLAQIDKLDGVTGLVAAVSRRDLDLEFHLALVELVGNALAAGVQRSLLSPLQEYSILWLNDETVEAWQLEHREIVGSLEGGDPPAAQRAVAAHLEGGRCRLAELLGADDMRPPAQTKVLWR